MRLIKVKGIIIKEIPYKDNDKIVTILTDSLGKISCLARGAKRTNSPILANCQYLVYSEFILYKSKTFYHINSASIINMFYDLRVDYDKLQVVFDLTRLLQITTDENQDTSKILTLFLNTIYVIENMDKNKNFVETVFKIRLFSLLGFSPRVEKCNSCGELFSKNKDELTKQGIVYDYVSNTFCCSNCAKNIDKRRCIKVNESTLIAIKYVLLTDIKKIFSFNLRDIDNFVLFGQVFTDAMTNGI